MYEPWIIDGRTPYHARDFWEMPWRKAERFTKWFIASIPDRIASLEEVVRSTPGFELWRADGSRESCADLGPWVLKTLDQRKPTEDDIREMGRPIILNPDLPDYIKEDLQKRRFEPEWVFSNRVFARSVLADIGTYIGESLRGAGRDCAWGRCRDKRDYNYNQPLMLWRRDGTTGYHALRAAYIGATKMIDREVGRDVFGLQFDEGLHLATFEPPVYAPTPQRKGEPVKGTCPKCGFGFALVGVEEGIYCNHCAHLSSSFSVDP